MIIFVDLDGTLLKDDSTLSTYSTNIINKLRENGHLFVFNTARSLDSVTNYLDILTPDYMILNGGNHIVNNKLETIYESRIPLKETKEIIKLLKNNNITNILIETGHGFITENKKFHEKHPDSHLINLDDINEGAFKFVYEANEIDLTNDIKNIYNVDIVNYVGGALHKVSVYGKENGNKELIKYLNTNDKTISFGDDLGDILMIQSSDIKVCMKNSQPELFKYDFDVTKYTNDEDGVCRYLEELLLK